MDVADPSKLRLASPYGLFLITADGAAERISGDNRVLMELVVHPNLPSTFFSSGYRSKTEKLGVIRSDDAGRTWKRIATGAAGPVAFHAMAISVSDPSTLYGVDKDVQLSRDGGLTWNSVGPAPGDVFDIAVSAKDSATIFAATREGLMVSRNGGRSWLPAHSSKRPATMVNVTPSGRIYTFIYGLGLMMAREPSLNWKPVSKGFQDRALIDMTIDRTNENNIMGVADTGTVMASSDGGRNWMSFEGKGKITPDVLAKGKLLFEENCQACHGVGGIGENPKDMYAKDEFGFKAPALNDDAHAWHHTDRNLINTILKGSPRNERMIAWKDHLSRKEAEKLVAYMKSLWSFRSLACQGARHMKCMR